MSINPRYIAGEESYATPNEMQSAENGALSTLGAQEAAEQQTAPAPSMSSDRERYNGGGITVCE